MTNKSRKIIDYVFQHKDTPDDIQRMFEGWMVAHEEDHETTEALREVWNEHAAPAADEEDRRGLERLHASIRAEKPRRSPRVALRWACTAAAAISIFVGGYYAAIGTIEPIRENTLLTAKGQTGEFSLPDGTTVWLNGESRLKYDSSFEDETRDVYLSGEAFFEVRKDSLRPFRVHMNNLQIEVLGTSFDAMSYSFGSSQQIVLKTGSVKISGNNLQRPVTLHPNERFTFDKRTQSARIEQVNAQNYCQWFSPRLVFDNTPLKDIITNLERRYNIEISLSTHISPEKRISLVICHEPLEDIMEVMSSLMSVQYRIDGNHVLIMRR